MTINERLIGYPPNFESASQQWGKNYLLVIGIDKYADADVPTLKNAVRDTERLTQILTFKYDFQLLRPLHDAEATRSAVLEAIEELENTLKAEDNLVIFFSGHGYRKKEDGFIVPFDGHNNKTTNYISFVDLNRMINALPMHHFLFILDCCFAGSALKNLGEKRELNKPSRRILAASSPDETAEDGFFGRNSPFTSALAEILEGNERAELPVKNLHAQLRDLMDGKGNRQVSVEGSWKMDSNRDGEFIFFKKDVELDTWNALDKTDKNALKTFVAKFPNSGFAAEATALSEAIEQKEAQKRTEAEAEHKKEAEKQAYERAKANPTAYNLNQFLKNYPLSIHAESIEKRLAEAEEEAAWKDAKNQNRITEYRGFIRRFPNSSLVVKANENIEVIEKALEAEEARRQNVDNQAIEREKQAKLAADKLATDKLEAEQKRLWQQEVEQLKKDEDTLDAQKLAQDQRAETEKRRIEEAASLEKERLADAEERRLKQIEKERLEKEKTAQVVVNQQVKTVVEPSFLQKYKLHLMGGCGLLLVFAVWFFMPKNEPIKNPQPVNPTPSVIKPSQPISETPKTQKPEQTTPSVSTASIEPKMIKVEGGTFQMGSNNNESDEKPVHSVNVSSFYIGKYEVSQAEWQAVMGKNPSYFKRDNLPVEQVSWDDIQEFLKKLNAGGKKYRLPTEAEWEFAARGGNNSKGYTYSGSNDAKSVAWLIENSNDRTHAVGGRKANELGIYDMSGNVWEWCSGWYDENYYKNSPSSNPKGAASGSLRVYRGGGWYGGAVGCRSAFRNFNAPAFRDGSLGFRLAMSL